MADLLSLPKSDAIRTVKNGIDRGMRTPRSAKNLSMEPKDPGDTVLMWMRWWQSLDPAKFPGTKGSSLLKTLAGVAMLGMAYGGPVDVGASYRQIAEAAGKRVSTVTLHLRRGGPARGYLMCTTRLRPHQWLRSADQPQSSRWTPVCQPAKSVQPMDSCCRERPDCPEKPGLVDPAGNRWHHAANVGRIDCVLDHEEEVTVAEVVKVTGLTADTVLRHLHSLAETGHADG